MADEKLRQFQREATANPSLENVLRYSRALQRTGLADEAVGALLMGEPSTELDAAISSLPLWNTPEGGEGRTRWVDLAPLERGPALCWARHRADWCRTTGLIADPRALVVGGNGVEHVGGAHGDPYDRDAGFALLDPDTGHERAFCSGPKDVLGLVGDAVIATRWLGIPYSERSAAHEVSGWDLRTGERRWEFQTDPGRSPKAVLGRALFVIRGEGDDGAQLTRYPIDPHTGIDPRSGQALIDTGFVFQVAGVGDGTVVLGDDAALLDGARVLKRHPRASSDNVAGDAGGWLLFANSRLAVLDREGEERVQRPPTDSVTHVVLAPEHVAIRAGYGSDIQITDRDLHELRVLDGKGAGLRAGARRWLFCAGKGQIRGLRLDGRAQWKHPTGAILNATPQPYRSWDSIEHLAPGWGRRLYGVTEAGTAFCLEQRRVNLLGPKGKRS